MPTALPRTLIFLGWALFAVALFCPALREGDVTLRGWKCLLATLCCFPLWLFWPVAPGALANFTFFFGVLVYSWGGGLERKAYGVFLALAACGGLAAVVPMLEDARVGCYLWLASLFSTAAGFLLADRPQSPT
jgi:hypothetical protein